MTPAADPWLLTDGPSLVNQIRPVSSSNSFSNLVSILNTDIPYADANDQPGFWVDPDIMEVGNGGLSGQAGDQAEMSLFSELAMPLLTSTQLGGTDSGCTSFDTPASYSGPTLPSIPFYTPPSNVADSMYSSYATTTFTAPTDTTPGQGVPCALTPYLASVFGNADVVSVDQDPLGHAGHLVSSSTNQLVLTKPLANGDAAVVLFNEDQSSPATISTTATAVGLPTASSYAIEDLWTKSVSQTTGDITAVVPAGGVVMLRIAPASIDAACASLVSGATLSKNLSIPAGSFCQLSNVTVKGNITVGAGGYLSQDGGRDGGNVQSNGGNVLLATTSVTGNVSTQESAVQLRGVSVNGNVSLDQANGLAVVCGTTIGGNLALDGSNAHSDLCGNSVAGNVQVQDNTGPVWVLDNSADGNSRARTTRPPRPATATRSRVTKGASARAEPLARRTRPLWGGGPVSRSLCGGGPVSRPVCGGAPIAAPGPLSPDADHVARGRVRSRPSRAASISPSRRRKKWCPRRDAGTCDSAEASSERQRVIERQAGRARPLAGLGRDRPLTGLDRGCNTRASLAWVQ